MGEVVLSTGNDSSSSEKTEKKPKIAPSPSKKPSNKQVAFSRGGYVKRRRKPKVVVQKTSSTESEDLTDSDGEISNYYLPTSLTPQSLSQAVVSPILNEVFD